MTALKNLKHEAVLQAFIASKERIGWKAYAAIYKNSSQRAAEVAWSRLLKIAEFSARLAELEKAVVDKVVEKTGITLEKVVNELVRLGFSNMLNYAEVDGGDLRLDFTRLTEDEAAAIKEITVETTRIGEGEDAPEITRTKFKLHDKQGPLLSLFKHLGGGVDRHEHTGKDGAPLFGAGEKPGELEVARRIAFLLERGARAAAAGKQPRKGKP